MTITNSRIPNLFLSDIENTAANKGTLPRMGGDKEYPPMILNKDRYKVEYDGPNDPLFPHNWPMRKKIIVCLVLCYSIFLISGSSSMYGPAIPSIGQEFDKGSVTTTLGVTLFVFGFALGGVLLAPLSELYGRKLPTVLSIGGFTIFSFAVAVSKDFQSVMINRFFAAFFGSAALIIGPAVVADIFNDKQRGSAIGVVTISLLGSPLITPLMGGFITSSYLGWRWTQYLTGILSAAAFVLLIIFQEESYHPMILAIKAKDLRKKTGNWGIYAAHEETELDLRVLIGSFVRPIILLIREPFLLAITIYTSFVYGILYMLLEAYPIIFAGGYKMSLGISQLPYLSMGIGQLISMAILVFYFEPKLNRQVQQSNGEMVPERRLPDMILGSITLTIGIFWLTWTGNYSAHVHWLAPTFGGLFIGHGIYSIFLSSVNYLLDCYLVVSASALASNVFLRSAFGAVFPLFSPAMFNNLGINWAGTLVGCLAILLIPGPILFSIYGKKLRELSKYK